MIEYQAWRALVLISGGGSDEWKQQMQFSDLEAQVHLHKNRDAKWQADKSNVLMTDIKWKRITVFHQMKIILMRCWWIKFPKAHHQWSNRSPYDNDISMYVFPQTLTNLQKNLLEHVMQEEEWDHGCEWHGEWEHWRSVVTVGWVFPWVPAPPLPPWN